jgi:hypothetical protein
MGNLSRRLSTSSSLNTPTLPLHKKERIDCYRCRITGSASGSGGPPGERNGQYRHGERTKAAISEQRKFSALLKMLRAGLT